MPRLLAAFVVLALLPSVAAAERLPIRAYTTADGLAHNSVNKIVRDSRGFLWFATKDGLSRFDGYTFSNYGVDQGLPHSTVMDLVETRSGELWVATFGGLVRFRPDGIPGERAVQENDAGAAESMFAAIVPDDADPRARMANVVFEARDGTIWCGTRKGLFRLDRIGGRSVLTEVAIGLPSHYVEQEHINDIVEDDHGTLWLAAPSGLYRRWADGTSARYPSPTFSDYHHLHDLMKDRDGRIWVGTRYEGFFRIRADATRTPPVVVEHHGYPRQPVGWVYRMLETSDGRFWLATNLGITEFVRGEGGGASRFIAYNRSHGLTHQEVAAMAEDAGGNLWLGTWSGAMKVARHGFVTFGRQDGVAGGSKVLEDMAGDLHVLGHVFLPGMPGDRNPRAGDEHVALRFGRFDGRSFEWFSPGKPYLWGWAPEGSIIQRRNGEWWVASALGLFRYPPMPSLTALKTAKPIRIFTPKDGLPDYQVYRLFEDSRGDVWFSVYAMRHALLRWNQATDSLSDMTSLPGFPSPNEELARSFAEDRAGNVWVGLNSGVARFRSRRVDFYTASEGFAPGAVPVIHVDREGRGWFGSARGGLIRVDDPTAARPVFARYTTAQGLSGNTIEAITDDAFGRIYVGTGRGLDQLDPQTGRIKQFTSEDGLATGWMIAAFRDRSGALWFATHTALSRFSPPRPDAPRPPTIFITGLTVGGRVRPVSAIGETDLPLSDLELSGSQVQIDFASLRFASGDRLRYQYRLEGADEQWGPVTSRRSVTYASLAPGSYRFLVRAINADGLASLQPAVVTFQVLPPFWRRWWFLAGSALAVLGAALALHRYRLAKILELERVRMRIATDLHDDVGANLTRIAILSEVARRQPSGTAAVDAPLSSIADIARESVETMSDIVWAITPERDTLRDIVRRMRDHAEQVFETRDIRLLVDMTDIAHDTKLGVDARRDLYLIFKEAVNNAARHSACSSVAIVLRVDAGTLWLEVTDDGVGFDPARHAEGNGVGSMTRRAARLGASLEVRSAPRSGTTVRLTMPVGDWRAVAVPARRGR